VRSGCVESLHSGHLVCLGADGTVVASAGDPAQPVFPRSCAKPLQAVGMHGLGFAGPPAWLALAASSHSGEALHLEVVAEMLAAGGFSEDDLQCPPDRPLDSTRPPSRLAMNCSGKHAAMLLTCRAQGWP